MSDARVTITLDTCDGTTKYIGKIVAYSTTVEKFGENYLQVPCIMFDTGTEIMVIPLKTSRMIKVEIKMGVSEQDAHDAWQQAMSLAAASGHGPHNYSGFQDQLRLLRGTAQVRKG